MHVSDHTMGPAMSMKTPSPATDRTDVGPSRALLYAAVLPTLGAALIHLAVAPQHFAAYLPYGLFFVAVGTGQLALAVALVAAPARRLFIVGLASSLGLLALWALSRTVGVPIGPRGPWQPEPLGF